MGKGAEHEQVLGKLKELPLDPTYDNFLRVLEYFPEDARIFFGEQAQARALGGNEVESIREGYLGNYEGITEEWVPLPKTEELIRGILEPIRMIVLLRALYQDNEYDHAFPYQNLDRKVLIQIWRQHEGLEDYPYMAQVLKVMKLTRTEAFRIGRFRRQVEGLESLADIIRRKERHLADTQRWYVREEEKARDILRGKA